MGLESVQIEGGQHTGKGGVSGGTGWIEDKGVVAICHAPSSAYQCLLTKPLHSSPTKLELCLLACVLHSECVVNMSSAFPPSFAAREDRSNTNQKKI